jgi:ribosome-associated protein
VNFESLISELSFKAIRSSGSGGQHVNKVASKIELHFNIMNSNALSEEQKALLLQNLKPRLTNNNELILQCDESRSQHKNKQLAIKRFISIIEDGLIVPKKRVPTKTPKAVIKKRLETKKKLSDKKMYRKKPDLD